MISFLDYFRQGYRYRELIMTMARRELVRKYIGSSIGLMWAVVHPLFMISILWVVFGLGFKAAPARGVPFVVYLTAGLSCWYLFSDIVSGSTGVVMEHAELIKKMPFPSEILPFIKTIVGIVNHAIFIIILIVLIAFHSLPADLYYIQALYYLSAMFAFALGLSWLCASLTPFFKDVEHFIAIILQVGMWYTPVLWDLGMLPEKFHVYFIYNPMFYIVQGFRDSFIYFKPFWCYPKQTAVFWGITFTLLSVGGFSFKRLKDHFPDVL